MKCPHCNQTPIWDRYERCSDPACITCGATAGWFRNPRLPPTESGQLRARRSVYYSVIYVCRLCNEAVS